eukprot:2831832-Amphidinium_carterae.1
MLHRLEKLSAGTRVRISSHLTQYELQIWSSVSIGAIGPFQCVVTNYMQSVKQKTMSALFFEVACDEMRIPSFPSA